MLVSELNLGVRPGVKSRLRILKQEVKPEVRPGMSIERIRVRPEVKPRARECPTLSGREGYSVQAPINTTTTLARFRIRIRMS